MTHLLFPGRHHVLTNFKHQELNRIVKADPTSLVDVHGNPLKATQSIDDIIWSITSANHHNTRRNPIPGNRREVGIEMFAEDLSVSSFVYHIDDVGTTPHFAEYILKKVEVESQGRFHLTPENTVIGCSTPQIISLYES